MKNQGTPGCIAQAKSRIGKEEMSSSGNEIEIKGCPPPSYAFVLQVLSGLEDTHLHSERKSVTQQGSSANIT